jgi:hypothetical protein
VRALLRVGAAAIATSAFTVGGLAGTANAQPVAVGNLVNVQITNLLNNNEVAVQIPIQAAANICDVSVVVLAQDVTDDGATCTARNGNQELTITQ